MSNTILYWRGSADVRSDLIGALANRRLGVVQVRSLEEVLLQLETLAPLLLIIDASSGENEVTERIFELSSTELLLNQPLLFVGLKAERRTEKLRRSYAFFRVLDVPYKLSAVLNCVAACGEEEKESEPEKPEAGEEESQTLDTSIGSRSDNREIIEADDTKTILSSFQDPINIPQGYGGRVFAIARDIEDFNDELLIPAHPARDVIKSLLDTMSETNAWAGLQARRVSFVSGAIANSLGFPNEHKQNVRIVGLFLNWALAKSSRNLLRCDLMADSSQDLYSAFAKGIRESAQIVGECFNDPLAAETLDTAGQLLASEPPTSEPEIVQDAKCVLTVEIAARSCWHEGAWNPIGVYRAIRHLRQNQLLFFDDGKIAGAVLRVLGEAVTAHVTVKNAFVEHLGDTGRGLGGASEPLLLFGHDAEAGQQDILTMHPSDLRPGMRVARPFKTHDGKIILDADTVLDSEMVYLLWQLAAIRALDQEVAVERASLDDL